MIDKNNLIQLGQTSVPSVSSVANTFMAKNLRGFTLIEILIAIVLLSMILLLLFSSLYTANKHWQIGEKKIEKNNEIRLVNKFIRRQISQATPILWVEKDNKQLLFKGKNNELNFIANLPAHRGGGGLHALTLKVTETDDAKQLVLSYSLLTPDNEPFTDSVDEREEFVVIADDIDSISFFYFGSEEIGDEPHWFDEWSSNEEFPQLVKIQINSTNENIVWPLLEIPVKSVFISGEPTFIIQASSS